MYKIETNVHFASKEPKCSSFCTLEYNPQCGTNGVTYGNPCALRGAVCKSDGEITLAYSGECKSMYIMNM